MFIDGTDVLESYTGGANMQSDAGTMVLPSPNHIGVVVKNTDKTLEFLSSMWGLGPWQTFEYSPSKDEMIAGEPFRLKIAFTKLGSTVLELLQPLEGNSIWAQALETKGEGIHHIAFSVSNWDEMVSRLQEEGGRMVAGAILKGKRWSYFETKPGGIIVEFMDNYGL